MKDADFQPRIALVTRTVSNAASDLAHFIVLFGSVAIGYSISGTILFGHQYDAFSTLSNSCFYILILLIAFNPGEGWVQVSLHLIILFGCCFDTYALAAIGSLQMNHAAPDWAFNIYLWSWILIALFILVRVPA
jgi:hypothetical protein